MPNTMLTPTKIAKEALMLLENELVMGNKVYADYSTEYGGVKPGSTITIRRPTAYLGQNNNLDITSYREDVIQGSTTIAMDQTVTIPVETTALERTLSFDRFSEDIIRPAVIRMKDIIEARIAATYSSFYWFTGTPGTVPSTFLSLAQGMAIMTDAGIPTDRFAVHGTQTSINLADGLRSVYVEQKAKTAFEEAKIGRYGGFDNYMSVHAPVHTVGALGGTPLVNGANQNVTYAAVKDTWTQSLVTDGWANSVTNVLRAGDVFTIAGVNAVNWLSKQDTGRLQTFVVTANANSGASTGPATLTISPPIITTGAYQTVTAAPADNAAITVVSGAANSARPQSLLLHPKAIALVTRPLDIPQDNGLRTSTQTGNRVTLSVTEFTNGNTLAQTIRFDMLFGVKVIDPRLGARLTA